jgi:hypothetical protein
MAALLPIYKDALVAFERAYFSELLLKHRRSVAGVAEEAGMDRSWCYAKLASLGLWGNGPYKRQREQAARAAAL